MSYFSFRLECQVVPDDPLEMREMNEAQMHHFLADRLERVLANSTAVDAISEGMRAEVRLTVINDAES